MPCAHAVQSDADRPQGGGIKLGGGGLHAAARGDRTSSASKSLRAVTANRLLQRFLARANDRLVRLESLSALILKHVCVKTQLDFYPPPSARTPFACPVPCALYLLY
ncbi:hypothetical protein BS78_05G034400 [Paspalum vaginatum]|nr:hypothetical protein BS78_05G034400 [Paspalum vaginatum]